MSRVFKKFYTLQTRGSSNVVYIFPADYKSLNLIFNHRFTVIKYFSLVRLWMVIIVFM